MNLRTIEKEKNAVLILAAAYKAYDDSFILNSHDYLGMNQEITEESIFQHLLSLCEEVRL